MDDCIKLQLTAGGVVQFTFNKGTGPLTVKKTYHNMVYMADEETTNACQSWIEADHKYKT